MTTAKTHRRAEPRNRRIRKFKDGTARDAIGELTPCCELYCLTFGQFSLIDALCAIIEQTGPADVTLATWTAAHADLERAEAMLRASHIRSMRYIVDRSFLKRMPHYCRAMRELFGPDCIRAVKSHAKWAVIRNDQWSIAMRTSMNMNHNPRLENLEISDDPALADFLTEIADEIYRTVPADTFDIEEIPQMDRIDWDKPQGQATASRVDVASLRPVTPGTIAPQTSGATPESPLGPLFQ